MHDIGYSKVQPDGSDMGKQAQYSLEILEQEGYEIDDKLKDCTLHHGTNDKPTTEEGKIFQLADKASIYNIDTLKAFLDFPKEALRFLKALSDGAYELLEQHKS